MHEQTIFDKDELRMSMFSDWMRRKKLSEGLGNAGDPDDGFDLNSDDSNDFAVDHEHVKKELFNVVMSKYPDETMQFLDGIAQRGDEEVSSLLGKLRRDKKSTSTQPRHPFDGDEVVPSAADSGYNNFGGED